MAPIEQAIQNVRSAITHNTGYEPSVSVLQQSLDELESALQSMQWEAEPFGYLIYDHNENTEDFTRVKPEQINYEHEEVVGVYLRPAPAVLPAQSEVTIDLLKAAQGAIRLDQPDTAHGYIGAVIDVLSAQEQTK